ncbi:MAG: dihydropteroate synthase [Turicibacter sp.]|nr:dihydropteroate synthase [Turicibacter sp.]
MEIMGILNITPDSFSDGGKLQGLEAVAKQAKLMVSQGATILDIGGESTRPGAKLVSEDDEISRVIPVIKRLACEVVVPLSIDTYKAEVARQAVLAGASIINDIGGAKFDPLMPKVMAESGAKVILMHNRSVNTVNQGNLTEYQDIMAEVRAELQESIDLVLAAGVSKDNIYLDPGIGFAKTHEGNVELLRRLHELQDMGYPILLGVSKKGTIGQLLGGLDVANRLEGTMAVTAYAHGLGIDIIRVHDVLENARVATVLSQLRKDGS